jgi:hypothetical protein
MSHGMSLNEPMGDADSDNDDYDFAAELRAAEEEEERRQEEERRAYLASRGVS